jgi:hypothetical protein
MTEAELLRAWKAEIAEGIACRKLMKIGRVVDFWTAAETSDGNPLR